MRLNQESTDFWFFLVKYLFILNITNKTIIQKVQKVFIIRMINDIIKNVIKH